MDLSEDANQTNQTEPSVETRVQLAEDLLEAIIRQVQLVEINLDAEDDPQIIFETLNARGAPLSASDLIRNFIFLYATRHQENVVELYENHWRPFEETPDSGAKSKTKRFWKEEERQGRLRTNRLDLFFYHYLTFRTETDIKLGHIFQEFKDWWDDSDTSRSAGDELNSLSEAAEVYRKLLTPNKETRLGRLASILHIMDTTTIYPVMFFLELTQPRLLDSELDGIYDDLESYLVRRAICNFTPKNYNRIFLSMLKHLRGKEKATREYVQEYLISLQGESAVWPDDDTFMQHFVFDPLYTRLRSPRVQMILEALEKCLATSFQESMSLDSYLSIEHIWPQHPASDTWPSVPKRDDGSADWTAIFQRQNVINCIGNLTLVTPSFNSSLRNRAFAEKKPAIMKESRLRLNVYFQEFSNDGWTEEAIIQRAKSLFSSARIIWPRA